MKFKSVFLYMHKSLGFESETCSAHVHRLTSACLKTNLVPRVHWLFGQREGASRDSGIMEKNLFF